MQETAAPSGSGALALLQAVGEHGGKRMRRALTAVALAQTARRGVNTWTAKSRMDHQFTISVPGDDALYGAVHAWVLDQLPATRRRAMTARTTRADSDRAAPIGGTVEPRRVRLFFDGTRAQSVTIDGHLVRVEVERPQWAGSGDIEKDERSWRAAMERVILTASSAAGRDAVLAWLEQIAAEQTKRRPRVRIAGKWGGWNYRSDVPARPLHSVVLRDGQRETLLADMTRFLAAEADYTRWGMPYHRGYLFHGVPGTGKTSTASALAAALGLDLYFISIGSLDNDQSLLECLNGVEARSMLLLEDIDVVHGAKSRDDTAGGVTLAGLLNALDGVPTPHGLLTVMTTNDRNVIDPAMLRPGRVDVEMEMLPLDDKQLAAMCLEMLGPMVRLQLPKLGARRSALTPADVVGVFKDHMGDPQEAADALAQFLSF